MRTIKLFYIEDFADKRASYSTLVSTLNNHCSAIPRLTGVRFEPAFTVDEFVEQLLNPKRFAEWLALHLKEAVLRPKEYCFLIDAELADDAYRQAYQELSCQLLLDQERWKEFWDVLKPLLRTEADGQLGGFLILWLRENNVPFAVASRFSDLPTRIEHKLKWLPARIESPDPNLTDPNHEQLLAIAKQVISVVEGLQPLSCEDFRRIARDFSHKELNDSYATATSTAGIEHAFVSIRRFLRLADEEFRLFLDGGGRLKVGIKRAFQGFALDHIPLPSVWLLALGIYRQVRPEDKWPRVWTIDELESCGPSKAELFPKVSREVYESALQALLILFHVLFQKNVDQEPNAPLLRARLERRSLAFTFSIPFSEVQCYVCQRAEG